MKLSILAAVSSCLVVSCHRSPSLAPQGSAPLAQDVIASVEGHAIRLAELKTELERRARGRTDAFARPEDREALLDELVKFESTYLRAKQSGFDQKPEIARQIKAFIVDRFREEQLKNTPESPAVSEVEVAAYYRDHAGRYALPEKARFAVIQLDFTPRATDEKQAEVLRKAGSVLAEASALNASQHAFGALAQRYSEDQATRYIGGDAGWLARGEQGRWNKGVVDAAFALTTAGEVSPVIQTPKGLFLVRLIEKQNAGQRPLKEVAEAIRYQLILEKRHKQQQEFYDAMTAGLRIEINRALLETISVPIAAPPTAPPGLPGS